MCRLGLVGYGHWGVNLARNIAAIAGGPVFICDQSPSRLAAARAVYPNCFVTSDWHAALAQPADAVVIASPSNQHFSMAWDALAAGRHVFIEKPLVLSANHAERLIEQASARGLRIMADHTFLYSSAIQTAARLIAAGAIGQLTSLHSERLNAGGIRQDAPVHWDLAAHDLAILDYLLPGTPVALSALSSPCGYSVEMSLRYQSGFEARISSSWVADSKRRLIEIEGTGGSLRIDELQPTHKLRLFDSTTGAFSFPKLESREPLAVAMQHFVECIQHSRTPLSCATSALRGIRLLSAADESLRNNGMEVTLECSLANA